MAITTYKTFLMKGTGTGTITWAKLVDIKDFPDLGGDPDTVDITTLSDACYKYLMGLQSNDSKKFTCNYDPTDYGTLAALDGVADTHYAVWFGGTETGGVLTPDGSSGKFSFDGQLHVFVSGGGVNEPVNMSVTITPSTGVTYSAS